MSRHYRTTRSNDRRNHMDNLHQKGINPSFTYGPKNLSRGSDSQHKTEDNNSSKNADDQESSSAK